MKLGYLNDILWAGLYIKQGMPALLKVIKEFNWQPKTYQEFYPSDEYQNLITEKNREAVEKLNTEVEKFRKRLAENLDTLTIEEFNAYCKSIVSIIDPKRGWKH